MITAITVFFGLQSHHAWLVERRNASLCMHCTCVEELDVDALCVYASLFRPGTVNKSREMTWSVSHIPNPHFRASPCTACFLKDASQYMRVQQARSTVAYGVSRSACLRFFAQERCCIFRVTSRAL